MRRITIRIFGGLLVAVVALAGCSQSEVNPYSALQDQTPPTVTSFVYSGGQASWSTDEMALCVLEYGEVGGDVEHYVYESTKYHSTHHTVKLLGMEDGVDYVVRVRSIDRAGNEAYESNAALPDTVTGASFRGETMSLAMIDVGWGLSELLTTPSGAHVLIDAGYSEKIDDVLGFLSENGVTSLRAAVMTHSHADHYGGFTTDNGVLQSHWAQTVVLPDPATLYNSIPPLMISIPAQYGMDVVYVTQGDGSANTEGLDWDDTPGFKVEVLSAGIGGIIDEDDDSGTEGMNTNNDSVVLRMTFGDVSFITTGDAEHFTEYYIINEFGREGCKADLLQIAHHGSDDSSSELWLDNVSPRVAFISCAMIEAALEKEEVLQGIRAVDADYFVTDRVFPNTPRDADPDYGNVIATTDGATIEVVIEQHSW
ncbi:hypothetical protein K8S17_00170 [bacterium]|nr:hypothetical protein [bacterium]